jgi:hypothetical protein
MVNYCPDCGQEAEKGSIYCLNCGKKLPDRVVSRPKRRWDAPAQPSPSPRYHAHHHQPVYQPRPFHPGMRPPIADRCVAALIDSFITDILIFVCVGCIYPIIKDGIRDGQSFGKGMLNLRVVDYNTGMPANMGQSCIRNCMCGWLDGMCCYLVMFLSEDGRRIGDHLAGTIVILDK